MDILAVNLGNSRAQAALWRDGAILAAAAAPTPSRALLRAVARAVARTGRPGIVAWASVAPRREPAFLRAIDALWPDAPRHRVTHRSPFPFPIDLLAPEKVGADRLADVAAAWHRAGAPCIVCDFGTASTFNVLHPKRGFCGGAIAPGYSMWFRALSGQTALLPDLAPDAPPPGLARLRTGRDTVQAIHLGARWGFRGMVSEIVWQLSRNLFPEGKPPVLLATGGWAPHVAANCGFSIDVVPTLTLEGIALVAARAVSPPR